MTLVSHREHTANRRRGAWHRRALLACALPTLACALSLLAGCTSLTIDPPRDGAIVRLPGPLHVAVTGQPEITRLALKIDGVDVSQGLTTVSARERRGDFPLPAGLHLVTAESVQPCWYCSGGTSALDAERRICVAAETTLASPANIARAKSDGRGWLTQGDGSTGVAADDGSLRVRWALIRLGGIGQRAGLIQSMENSCLCMRSMSTSADTPIGLALCDTRDPLQVWQALSLPGYGPNYYRLQNNGRGVSDACITAGANDQLVQAPCNDAPSQLWSLKDAASGQPVAPF